MRWDGLGMRWNGLGMKSDGMGMRWDGLGMRLGSLGMRSDGLMCMRLLLTYLSHQQNPQSTVLRLQVKQMQHSELWSNWANNTLEMCSEQLSMCKENGNCVHCGVMQSNHWYLTGSAKLFPTQLLR